MVNLPQKCEGLIGKCLQTPVFSLGDKLGLSPAWWKKKNIPDLLDVLPHLPRETGKRNTLSGGSEPEDPLFLEMQRSLAAAQ